MNRLEIFVTLSCLITVIVSWGYLYYANGGARELANKLVNRMESRKKRKKSI